MKPWFIISAIFLSILFTLYFFVSLIKPQPHIYFILWFFHSHTEDTEHNQKKIYLYTTIIVGVIANLWVLTLSEAHYSSFSQFFFLPLQIFQDSCTNYKPHHKPTCASRRPHFLYYLKIRAIKYSSFRLYLYISSLLPSSSLSQ